MSAANGDTPHGHLDQTAFRDVIGRFASGVTVVTTRAADRDFGTTASAVSSLSMDPPMLLICLNRTSDTREAILKAGWFAVNILSEGQADLAFAFARKSPDKFAQAEVERGLDGMPLIPGALAQLECRVTETATGGTHTVFMGEVLHATATEDAPLTYYRGRFGRFEERRGDVRTAEEAIDARCAIEIAVVDKVSGRIDPADVERLQALAGAAHTAAHAQPPDIPELLRSTEGFHEHFIGLLNNETLTGFFQRLDLRGIWSRTALDPEHRGPTSADYLSDLVTACAQGNSETARKLLHAHAEAVKQDAREAIERGGGEL